MPIRYYLLSIILACTVGGLALSISLHQGFERIENRFDRVGANSLVLKEVDFVGDELKRILIISDLVIGSSETHLAENAIDQCNSAIEEIQILEQASLLQDCVAELEVVSDKVQLIQSKLSVIYDSTDIAKLDFNQLLNEFDDASYELVDIYEKVSERSRENASKAEAMLQDEKATLYKLSGIGLAAYLIASFFLGKWAWSSIARPIQKLQTAAAESMEAGSLFKLEPTGPSEVRQLTGTFSEFIGSLEDKVDQRTEELRAKASELGDEVRVRIATEEELKNAKQNAESANNAKSEFLANMSHEMRTPMNAILGFSDFLSETEMNAQQSDYVGIIQTSGKALLSLINDILDFSKVEAGKLDLEYRSFDLRDCVEAALDLVAAGASSKSIGLGYFMEADVPGHVVGDEARFRQVLLNFLSNAIKFTESGHVSVTLRRVDEPGDAQQHAKIEVAVQDTGMGIPEDKQNLLFQSFQQLQASTNRKFGGTGLGLAISKKLVELMGGEVGVHSVAGQGSTFTFSIMAEVSEGSLHAFEQPHQGEHPTLSILMVYPHPYIQELVRRYCQAWNYRLTLVSHHDEALETLKQGQTFDALLSNMDQESEDQTAWLKEVEALNGKAMNLIGLSPINQASAYSSPAQVLKTVQLPLKPKVLYQHLQQSHGEHHRPEPTKQAESQPRKWAEGEGLHILIVDDISVNRKLAGMMVKAQGHRSEFAVDGREAISTFFESESPFDLVLMDMQMPEVDGIEATQEIRRRCSEEQKEQPIIFALTANSMERDRTLAKQAGMDDFLLKPIKAKTLESMIVSWFSEV